MFTWIDAPPDEQSCSLDDCDQIAVWLVLQDDRWDGTCACAEHLDVLCRDLVLSDEAWPLAAVFAYVDDADAEWGYIERFVNA